MSYHRSPRNLKYSLHSLSFGIND
eukprot:Gb_30445 [translate_table: standard]